MRKINILDCTLRDGGYVNNWEFGKKNSAEIVQKLAKSNIDIIELGFIRDEIYNPERTVFTCEEDFYDILKNRSEDTKYAALIEMANYYPVEKIWYRNEHTIDAIRYSFWKRKLDEAVEYAKCIKEKGYDLFVQPTRVEQYSETEFADMIKMFNALHPTALYIVDTFGLLTHKDVKRYATIADKTLDKSIVLGYHAHNNMQQAFLNAVTFLEMNLDRKVCVDASIFGMGRGPGNLNTEIIAKYMNENCNGNYVLKEYYEIFDKYIGAIYNEKKWGYSMEYYLSAQYGANPSLVEYYHNKGFTNVRINKLLDSIPYDDRIRFSKEKAEELLERYGQ